jgi:serine/threonine protein kinase
VLGLDDVLKTVKALALPRFPYDQVRREEVMGEGETFVVQRCIVRNQVVAIKHLKVNNTSGEDVLKRRLKSIILELRIMRHGPLQKHPNIAGVFGYGWNQQQNQIMPYILVQFATHGTLRQYLKHSGKKLSIAAKELLLGDVAAAIGALHVCGIIHGDVKLGRYIQR